MEEARTTSHRCQLVFFSYLNCPKEEDDDIGVSHHRSETEGRQLLIVYLGMLFHDYKKCIESQQRSGIHSFHLDLVLPGHGHGPVN